MERRLKELSELHDFIEGVDKEVNMVLQNLQWDRKRFIEEAPKLTCTYEKSHNLAPEKQEFHERQCFLKLHSYDKDLLLPDPLYADAKTLIKLDKQAIITIINNATCGNPLFNQGIRSQSPEPWTLERLQATYTMDERRAIHDAVVQAVPSCHDLADLALPSNEDSAENPKTKSRAEILAELRDMKRRRAKYRVAAKTRNYSDVLRDVIKTQMELYGDAAQKTTTELDHHKSMPNQKSKNQYRDDYPPQEATTSLRDNGRQKTQDNNSSSDFPRNRNVKECIPPEKVRSYSRDRGRQPRDYYTKSYTKNEQRNNRNDYSRSRYESRKSENEPKQRTKDQSRERRVRNSSSSMHEENNLRENRGRHEYNHTSRHDENDGSQARKRKKNDTSDDSYKVRRKKKHREDSTSSERKESSSRRKHKKSKYNHAKANRERDRDRDDNVRIKSEIDKTAGRHSSENETRYDIHTSRHRNKHKKSKREIREKHKHRSSHRRDDICIKIERETPESSEIDTQSNFTRTLTHVSTSCNDYTSYSDSDHATSTRDRRTKDSHIHRGSHKQTNVRIKAESTETHSYRKRSMEENHSSSRKRERKITHVDKYNSNSGNMNESRIEIKKEPTSTEEYGGKEISHNDQYYSRNMTRRRRDSNSSWE